MKNNITSEYEVEPIIYDGDNDDSDEDAVYDQCADEFDDDENDDDENDEQDAVADEFDDDDAVTNSKSRRAYNRRSQKRRKVKSPFSAKRRSVKADKLGGVFWRVWKTLGTQGVVATAKDATIAVTTGILRHSYSNVRALLRAASIAVQGNMTKIISGAVAVGGAATTVNYTGATVFGLRIIWSDSWTACDYRPFTITITYPAGGAGTLALAVTPRSNRVELFVLLPSNAAGLGSIAPVATATVTVAADAIRAGSSLSVESLNARDI